LSLDGRCVSSLTFVGISVASVRFTLCLQSAVGPLVAVLLVHWTLGIESRLAMILGAGIVSMVEW